MSQIHMTLHVHDSDAGIGWIGGKFRTYQRSVESSFMPRPGDEVEVVPDITVEVRTAALKLNGDVEISLVSFQIDPLPEYRSLCDGKYRIAWDNTPDYHLESMLVINGWHFPDDDIESLDLTVRAYNVLKREGVHTIAQLVQHSIDQLYDMRNMGWKSIEIIESELGKRGLKLKPVRMYPNDYHHEEY